MVKNGIDRVFETLKAKNQKALIPYLAAGYPALEEEEALIALIKKEGANILELGIPFSDPIADGPTIQFASQEALKNGSSLTKILNWVPRLKSKADLPIIFMSYINPIMQFGFERFAAAAEKAGVEGLIVPDMIPEEGEELKAKLDDHNIHMIYLVAPTTPKARVKYIAKQTSGFLYAVSITGVTGARTTLPLETKKWLAGLQELSPVPVCVGFGISGPDAIRDLKSSADGFIVGSALVDCIRKNNTNERPAAVSNFIRRLSEECTRG